MITPKTRKLWREVSDDRYTELARKIFDAKKKNRFYEVSGTQWDGAGDTSWDASIMVHLTDDELALVDGILETMEKEGCSLEELQDEIPFYQKLCPDMDFGFFVPDFIDKNSYSLYYTFSALIAKTSDGDVQRRNTRIPIKDEEYITLLKWRLQNRRSSFNGLAESHPQLFCDLTRRFLIRLGYPEAGLDLNDPFLIFMDELDKDVFDEIGEDSLSEQIFECEEGEYRGHTCLNIKEKVLCFFMENVTWGLKGKRQTVDGVDAIAVQKVLGVQDYNGIYNAVKSRFGGSLDGVSQFRQFLDTEGISNTFSESED